MPDDVIEAVRAILEHGNTAEIKRRKNGEIIVLEVRRKVKKARCSKWSALRAEWGRKLSMDVGGLRPYIFFAREGVQWHGRRTSRFGF